MSHNNQYTSQMTSLDTIALTCARMGLTLMRHQTTSRFYQDQQASCQHAIAIPHSRFEVGLIQQADGTYTMNMDVYDPVLKDTMGPKGHKFLQQYAAAAAIAEAKQHRRVQVKETLLKNGNIQLQFTRR